MAHRVSAGLSPAAAGRRFGLTVGLAFGVLGGLLWWRDHPVVAQVGWGLGGALVLAALLVPRGLGPVERGWMAMARGISKVTTPLIMGIVYYVVVAPIGLLVRVLKGNPIAPAERDGTFWVPRDAPRSADMRRQF